LLDTIKLIKENDQPPFSDVLVLQTFIGETVVRGTENQLFNSGFSLFYPDEANADSGLFICFPYPLRWVQKEGKCTAGASCSCY